MFYEPSPHSHLPVFSPSADLFLAPPAPDSDGESDGSDRVPVPSFQNSFSQAFEEALLQLDKGPGPLPEPAPSAGRQGGALGHSAGTVRRGIGALYWEAWRGTGSQH